MTRNYVVFDPKILTVTHRNGQPLDGGASDAILAGDEFNPSEPRAPAGEKGGGEWTSGASGGGPPTAARSGTGKPPTGPGAEGSVPEQTRSPKPLKLNDKELALTNDEVMRGPARKLRSAKVEEIAAELNDRGSKALKALGVKSGKIEGPSS